MSCHITEALRCTGPEATVAWEKDRSVLDGHYECRVLYLRSAGPPPCPSCGAPRVKFYPTREMERLEIVNYTVGGVFRPVKIGDTTYTTKEALDGYRQHLADKKGIPVDQVGFETIKNMKEHTDEIRHAGWEARKEAGFDTQQFREFQRENRRKHGIEGKPAPRLY